MLITFDRFERPGCKYECINSIQNRPLAFVTPWMITLLSHLKAEPLSFVLKLWVHFGNQKQFQFLSHSQFETFFSITKKWYSYLYSLQSKDVNLMQCTFPVTWVCLLLYNGELSKFIESCNKNTSGIVMFQSVDNTSIRFRLLSFSFLPFQRLYRRHRDGPTAQRLGQARLHPGYRRLASHVLFPQYLAVGFSTPKGGAGIASRWRLTTTLCVCCSSSSPGNFLSYRSELIRIRKFDVLYPVFSKISYFHPTFS